MLADKQDMFFPEISRYRAWEASSTILLLKEKAGISAAPYMQNVSLYTYLTLNDSLPDSFPTELQKLTQAIILVLCNCLVQYRFIFIIGRKSECTWADWGTVLVWAHVGREIWSCPGEEAFSPEWISRRSPKVRLVDNYTKNNYIYLFSKY